MNACQFLILVGGMLLLSQSASFARWSEFDTIAQMINDHANLLLVAGLSLLASAIAIGKLNSKVQELEKKIRKLEK